MSNKKPKKMHDPICSGCNHINNCPQPCPPVQWIDGHDSRREPLLQDMAAGIDDHSPLASRDYNVEIADILRARRGRIEDIRAITNIRLRLIAAATYADISATDIARLLGISRRTIYRLIPRRGTPSKTR